MSATMISVFPLWQVSELTTVYQNTYKMGSNGIQMLVDKIAGGRHTDSSSKIVMPTRLVVRKSCGYQLKGYVR